MTNMMLSITSALLLAMSVPTGEKEVRLRALLPDGLADGQVVERLDATAFPHSALVEQGRDGRIVYQAEADEGHPALHFAGNAGAGDGHGAMIVLAGTDEEGAESLSLSMRIRLEEPKLATLARRTRGTEEVGYMLYILASGHVGFRLGNEEESVTLRAARPITPDDGWVDISVKWDGRIESGPNALLTVDGLTERGRSSLTRIPAIDGDLSLGGLQRSRDGGRPGGQYFAGWVSDFTLGTLEADEIAAELQSRSDFLRLPAVFGDNMVLQRDRQVPVWGWAEPGSTVTVEIAEQSHEARAGTSGRWEAMLAPVGAGGPHELVIRSGITRRFGGVLFGDVWICGGQSNMEWTVRQTEENDEAVEELRNASFPIRQIRMDRIVRAHPDRMGRSQGGWRKADADEVAHFSAVGYHFARMVHQELDVPIGLINATWGGAQIAPWMPLEALESDPRLSGYAEWVHGSHENNRLGKKFAVAEYRQWLEEAEQVVERGGVAPGPPPWPTHPIHANRQNPTGMYNGMVAPLAGYGISGFLFYQGESNRHDRGFYAVLLESLIGGWRDAWRDDDLPFLFVQVAPFRYRDDPDSLPHIQDAQRRVAAALRRVGMAVIGDLSDLDDIHPARKREVGRRLARLALDPDHGGSVGTHSPVPLSCQLMDGNVRLRFGNGETLSTSDGLPPGLFEIGDGTGVYHAVEARIEGAEVVLALPEKLPNPATVRFAWEDAAIPNLVGAAGLPASPFLIDVKEAR